LAQRNADIIVSVAATVLIDAKPNSFLKEGYFDARTDIPKRVINHFYILHVCINTAHVFVQRVHEGSF